MSVPETAPAPGTVTDLTARRSRLLGPIQVVRKFSKATGSPRSVLNVIASYADADTLVARPGRTTLARDTGFSRSTLRRAVRALEDLGEVEVLTEGHGDRATVYRITLAAAAEASSSPVDNPGETRPSPIEERVQGEPGEGSQRTRGRVHSEPLPVVTGIDRGEGATVLPRTCGKHRGVEDPPPCRGCMKAREAAEAADAAIAKAARDDARRLRLEREREEAARLAAASSPPPAAFREARRRIK